MSERHDLLKELSNDITTGVSEMRTDDSEVKYLKLKVSQDIFYSTFV